MTTTLIVAIVILFGVVCFAAFFLPKKESTSDLDHANARIETLEGDVQSLQGQIGVILGDKHPGGGLRAPSNSGRYRDRIADMQHDQDGEFMRLVDLENGKHEVKKKISDALARKEARKADPKGATQLRPTIFGSRRR